MTNARPVTSQILERLLNTLLLTGSAMVIALAVAAPLGMLAAIKRSSAFDHIANIVTTLGFSLPTFWIGLLLIWFFSV